jgi:hypothetical protein
MTIQKQFFDGTTASRDLLGWGMNVTDPLGVTNHYTTDSIAGQVSICQLSSGAYTVTEDPSAPAPPGCFGVPYQTFVNGALQPVSGTSTFTWNSASPVTVLFVNSLACVG